MDWGFIIPFVLVSSVFTLVGLLVLLLPAERYQAAVGRIWAVRRPKTRGQDLQRRLVGLLVSLFGFLALRSNFSGESSPRATGQTAPPFGWIDSPWLPFVLGLLVAGFGFFITFKPDPLIRWSQRRLFPERQIPESTLQVWRVGIRILGAVLVYSSADLFKLWLSR